MKNMKNTLLDKNITNDPRTRGKQKQKQKKHGSFTSFKVNKNYVVFNSSLRYYDKSTRGKQI